MEKILKNLFPVTVQITQEQIDRGRVHIYSTTRCVGALVLKSIVGDRADVSFGCSSGTVIKLDGSDCWTVNVKKDGIKFDMMEVLKPTTVTFELYQTDMGRVDTFSTHFTQ